MNSWEQRKVLQFPESGSWEWNGTQDSFREEVLGRFIVLWKWCTFGRNDWTFEMVQRLKFKAESKLVIQLSLQNWKSARIWEVWKIQLIWENLGFSVFSFAFLRFVFDHSNDEMTCNEVASRWRYLIDLYPHFTLFFHMVYFCILIYSAEEREWQQRYSDRLQRS